MEERNEERDWLELRIEKLESEIVDVLSKDLDEDYTKDIYALNKIFGDTLLIENIAQTFRRLSSNPLMNESRIIYAVSTMCLNEISLLLYESKKSLKELKKKLKDIDKMMIFLGTGVSFEADLDWGITSYCLDQTFGRRIEELNSKRCWERLSENEENRIRFQEIFTSVIKEKEPSAPHYYLASLFENEIIKYLVCFNWDDLIERAYREVYHLEPSIIYIDERSHSERFCKPHGCVKCEPPSNQSWIFPSGKQMNSYFEEYTKENMKTKRILFLSCGFDGSEQLKKYLKDLFGDSRFYDIRPDIKMLSKIKPSNGKNCTSGIIGMSPSRVLKEIISELHPEIFDFLLRQRDINTKTLKSIERDAELYLKAHESKKTSKKAISEIPQPTIAFTVNVENIFNDIKNSPIINNSTVTNSFNNIKKTHGDDVAKALLQIAKFIAESRNKEAGELFDSFNEEINKSHPKKSMLKLLWAGIEKVLPTITKLSEAIAKLKSALEI